MIPLDLTVLVALMVCFPLSVVVVISFYYTFRSLHHRGRSSESIYECAECGHVYTFARNRPMDRCPRCGNLNEAVRTS